MSEEYIKKLERLFSEEAIQKAKEISDSMEETKLLEKITEFLRIIEEKKE